MNPDVHIAHLRADTERMAVAYEHGPIDAPVAACPGWDMTKLVEHMAYIHRWADFAVRNARGADHGDIAERRADDDLAEWLRVGGSTLADHLASADPQADTWHVFPAEHKMWVWARRQAQETAMHRWDAETAATGSSSLEADLACDGISEYFELGLPRVLQREGVVAPDSTLHVRCNDVPGDVATGLGGDDATLLGRAEDLLLLLMGRGDRSRIEIVGNAAVADAWLSLPGW